MWANHKRDTRLRCFEAVRFGVAHLLGIARHVNVCLMVVCLSVGCDARFSTDVSTSSWYEESQKMTTKIYCHAVDVLACLQYLSSRH